MNLSKGSTGVFFISIGALIVSGCGMRTYPGQPGMVTNSYSKVDLEDLEAEGLYVYEVSYDNQANGAGVGAILTKLYPGALTYTTNVRTNADGTLYRNKTNYDGAVTEMISIPKENQIILPPDSTVQLLIDYSTSLDEMDDKNVAEQKIFAGSTKPILSKRGIQKLKLHFDMFRAARFTSHGNLAYQIESIDIGDKKFIPSQTISVETNVFQNGVQTSLTPAIRSEAVKFIEAQFPKGYKGMVSLHLKGVTSPLQVSLGINTIKTAIASGTKVIQNASQAVIDSAVGRYNLSN